MVRRQALAALATLTFPGRALAGDAPAAETDRSVAENYQRAVRDTDLVIGGALIGIHAPLATVKKVLLAFPRYKEIFPRLQQSRIVAEDNGVTDVYVRAPILHGLAHIWGIMRFQPPKPWRTRGIRIDGELVKGNIVAWNGTWMAIPCGKKRTLLKLEMFIEVDVPAPASAVNHSMLWATRKGVTAVRDIAECGQSDVKND